MMKSKEIKSKVLDILNQLFRNSGIDADILEYADLIDDVSMDSVTFIGLIVEVESSFDVIVPDKMLQMENFRNVDDIVEMIEKLVNFKTSVTNEREEV